MCNVACSLVVTDFCGQCESKSNINSITVGWNFRGFRADFKKLRCLLEQASLLIFKSVFFDPENFIQL